MSDEPDHYHRSTAEAFGDERGQWLEGPYTAGDMPVLCLVAAALGLLVGSLIWWLT